MELPSECVCVCASKLHDMHVEIERQFAGLRFGNKRLPLLSHVAVGLFGMGTH